jgi:flagellar biosynthetic protein FliR
MPAVALDSPLALLLVCSKLLIGMSLGFAVRLVFCAVEFAGEVIGLQMGLNFAGFFDPLSGRQATATSRFFGTMVAFLFIVINGHLLVSPRWCRASRPFRSARALRLPARRCSRSAGARDLRHRAVDRAAAGGHAAVRQHGAGRDLARGAADQHLRDRLPITLGVGLLGILLTLPMMEAPFTMALERRCCRSSSRRVA